MMVSVYDRSGWGVLELSGHDRLRFLHNQTTNNINRLQPGQGCDTVFVTSTARTIDIATVYATENSLLIIVSPARREFLLQWMDKYIFPMDKVFLRDISSDYGIISLIGADKDLLTRLGLELGDIEPTYGNHRRVEGTYVAVGNELGLPGYTLLVPTEEKEAVWQKIKDESIEIINDRTWETYRIERGRPVPDKELGEDYNPLEAGLWGCISFDKGCYIGQETIARLNTYKGVKQQLWGVKLNGYVEPGAEVNREGVKIGELTSCVETEEGAIGLVYVRSKFLSEDKKVDIGDKVGNLILPPMLSHEYFPGIGKQ